ncbi:dTDP-glucose 4,6-dehydratase [uncultured Tenacibaculum sp.]|uniref:dTDP-glucose 4,6-dehydratase n=1 Tax=uncultured Tenacibaculum sp. TaxID=174713 RepID=UPI0026080918|nr:dTDP-glucose 4,6-dehydratase [uncultured Tenacibaculum sp.]
MRNVLITGGAGFIGSHVVRLFVKKYPNYHIINLDALTYAGNLYNLEDLESASNYTFVKGDICDEVLVHEIFQKYEIDSVINLAAESHVDRSISDPFSFVKTNVFGTLNLLETAKNYWKEDFSKKLFYHVSTDEVYGSLSSEGFFTEATSYNPKSPYSASKASSDHFVRAFANTYGLPIVISNCSNNYGPNQFPEKLIPLCIHNICENKPIPVYGNGQNVRDWLYVEDHASAIDTIFHRGKVNETYNVGGISERTNIEIVEKLIEITDTLLEREKGVSKSLITYVTDRAGHDFRYAIDTSKIERDLNWKPSMSFDKGIEQTVRWYLENQTWLEKITDGSYKDYYKTFASKK